VSGPRRAGTRRSSAPNSQRTSDAPLTHLRALEVRRNFVHVFPAKPLPVAAVFTRESSPMPGIGDDLTERSWTRQEFWVREHISKSTYFKLRKAGLAPEETIITLPGFSLIRITPEARRAWHKKLAELRQSKEAELERARRQAQVEAAAQLAAASPNHVSNRARPVQRRPRR
jgi:hypothetical protein